MAFLPLFRFRRDPWKRFGHAVGGFESSFSKFTRTFRSDGTFSESNASCLPHLIQLAACWCTRPWTKLSCTRVSLAFPRKSSPRQHCEMNVSFLLFLRLPLIGDWFQIEHVISTLLSVGCADNTLLNAFASAR